MRPALAVLPLLLGGGACRHTGALPEVEGLEEGALTGVIVLGSADLQARAVLTEAAGSTDINVRRRALAFLVRTSPVPGGGEWGPRGRHDPSEFVRRSIVEALKARRSDSAAVELLRGLAEDRSADGVTRMAAALALPSLQTRLTPEWTQPLYLDAHGLDRGPLLLPAVVAQTPDSEAALVAFLEAGGLVPDRTWLRALGHNAPPSCRPALAAAIEHAEPEYTLLFAAAFLPAAPEAAKPALERALLGADTERALDALDLLRDDPSLAADELVARAARHGRRTTREVAAWMLVEHSGDADGLKAALQSGDLDVRVAALRAAGALRGRGVPLAADELARLRELAEPGNDTGTQLAAVEALSRNADEADRAALAPRLRDESPLVRAIAAEAWPNR